MNSFDQKQIHKSWFLKAKNNQNKDGRYHAHTYLCLTPNITVDYTPNLEAWPTPNKISNG